MRKNVYELVGVYVTRFDNLPIVATKTLQKAKQKDSDFGFGDIITRKTKTKNGYYIQERKNKGTKSKEKRTKLI